jgi:glycolate oxidase iron-sulfur subunit
MRRGRSPHSAQVKEQDIKDRLRRTADQCVKCGLCLPHCPTYRLRRDEGESPRGRIALVQGLAEDRLPSSARLEAHLGSCLECRACEVACPSLVQFASLMDDARALGNLRASPPRRRMRLALLDALSGGIGIRGSSLLAGVYRATGLSTLAERLGIGHRAGLHAYHRLALQLEWPSSPRRSAGETQNGGEEIDLFLGCVARAAQPEALRAARRVLARLGFRVRIPGGQGCCGAMHRHNGFPEPADRRLQANADAASGRGLIGIASACVAELKTHPLLSGTREICRFLADSPWPGDADLRPLHRRVAVHEPCSQRNQLRDADAAYALLRRIPGIEILPLPDNAFCCGAAGTYLLQNPAESRALLAPKLDALAALGAGILVTTNTGCALHLAAGARERGLALEVLHPVELISRQLGDEQLADDPAG